MITNIDAFIKDRDGDFTNFDYYGQVKSLLDIMIELGKHAEQTEFVKEIEENAVTLKNKITDEIIRSFPAAVRKNL